MNKISKMIRGVVGATALALVLGMGIVPSGAVSQGTNGTDVAAGTLSYCPPICW
jgi:hypothetical protein